MTLSSHLQQAVRPGHILSVQVGFSRTAVLAKTEDGLHCGLAATLTNPEYVHRLQPAVRQAGHLLELDYTELAALFDSPSFTEAAVGLAAINALLPPMPEAWEELKAVDYLIHHHAGKNIAMIGHFPFIPRLKPHVSSLWVLELNPGEEDLPAQAAPGIIPQADVVAMTATTLINRTFDGLMALCRPDTTVIMIGASTPLSPILYDFGVHVLCGAVVTEPQAAILGISQGISTHQLRQAGLIKQVTMIKT